METEEILSKIGDFSEYEISLFDKYTLKTSLKKNDILVHKGETCKSLYFILKGAFFQYKAQDEEEVTIDLHLRNEWMFNQESLTEQTPSTTAFKAFSDAEIVVLTLGNFHLLCSKSQRFLQFGKIINQSKNRTALFDQCSTPSEKYAFINKSKPELIKVFPLKMIASYLKITPETLSRVRANRLIS